MIDKFLNRTFPSKYNWKWIFTFVTTHKYLFWIVHCGTNGMTKLVHGLCDGQKTWWSPKSYTQWHGQKSNLVWPDKKEYERKSFLLLLCLSDFKGWRIALDSKIIKAVHLGDCMTVEWWSLTSSNNSLRLNCGILLSKCHTKVFCIFESR